MPMDKPSSLKDRPHLERCMRIAHDHILYAKGHPGVLKGVAAQLKISMEAALALAIAEQITEEFSLTERED